VPVTGQHQVVQNRQTAEKLKVLEGTGNPPLGDLMGRGTGEPRLAIKDFAAGGIVSPKCS